ncbi:MAG TPA: GNAT family N-acetyltransferase [Anaerolineaceae bacterium]|nr:GNAT family N-acetyltransferase [Anaerolineaceae bacterium]
MPFLHFAYLRNWWETRGGGEWKSGELAVVTAEEDGRLVGIAPLFFSQNREGEPALLLLGSIEISDFLDVIVRPQDVVRFTAGLLEFLEGLPALEWHVLDWYNILEDSPTLPAMEAATRDRGRPCTVEKLAHSPYIPLKGSWEEYLEGIDKKQRHEIRRKMRRVESSEQPARWYVVEDGNSLDAEGDAFLALMAQDPEKVRFLVPEMRRQMKATLRWAFDAGILQLAFLEIGGKKAAGYFNFDYQNRIWVYNSGLDNQFREYSPGWVLLGNLLQWATEQRREEFDFLRGNEEYKYRFGAVDRFVMRLTVRR